MFSRNRNDFMLIEEEIIESNLILYDMYLRIYNFKFLIIFIIVLK